MDYVKIELNTARNALRYIIKTFGIEEIYIPYYICPVVRNAIKKENCKINFYHIDEKFLPTVQFPKDSYILYPNYFGVCSKNVDELAQKYPNLIVDNAHSFFSEPKGLASFNSLRKFFPMLRDGSFLYVTEKLDEDIVVDDYSYELKILTQEEIIRNEYRLDNEDIKFISENTLKYFENIDLDCEKQRRIIAVEKFKKMYDAENNLSVDINPYDLPFVYPFLANDSFTAEKVVKSLSFDIYRYWTNLPDSFVEKAFYSRLVPINL